MKNIVATIQREQNAVIRNEAAEVLMLQGVAGSGKTSIAGRFLTKLTDDETFSQQVMKLLDSVDEAAAERIRYKATPQFVTCLQEWIPAEPAEQFTAAPIERRGEELTTAWIADRCATRDTVPIFTRLERVADFAVHQLEAVIGRRSTWTAADTTSVRKQVRAMFAHKGAFEMHKVFYRAPERQDLFVPLGAEEDRVRRCVPADPHDARDHAPGVALCRPCPRAPRLRRAPVLSRERSRMDRGTAGGRCRPRAALRRPHRPHR